MTEEGKLPIGIKESLARMLPAYAGKKMRMVIEEYKEKRSREANSYYWACIVPHVRHVRLENGDPVTIEQCHEDLLAQFAPQVKCLHLNGTPYFRAKRSKEMNVAEMAQYLTAITAAMSDFGSPVPINEGELS